MSSPSGIFEVGQPSTRAQYPLINATCNVSCEDVYLLTELCQEYLVIDTSGREINYVFRLPPTAAVCAFKALIHNVKVINGVVKEKEEAKALFQAAVARGKRAALLEKMFIDVFRVSLGNVNPSDNISIHLTYVSLISHDGSSPNDLRLTIPVAVAERYGVTPYDRADSQRPKTFKLDVSFQMNGPITAISSPSNPITVNLGLVGSSSTFNPNMATIAFQDTDFLNTDVVIVVSAQKLDAPRCAVERWSATEGAQETTDAYALTFVPKYNPPVVQSQEYIFLVDRSGSMSGDRIDSVKEALQIMLRSLPSRNTTFNIISFGSRNSSLWPTSQAYNKDAVDQASKQVETFEADFGGTELSTALRYAYGSKAGSSPEHRPSTAVFVLTDGDVWDLTGVKDEVEKHTKQGIEGGHMLRTFVLGVGDGVAVGMCEEIATAGNGVAIFVGPREKPDAKLVNLLRAARTGVIERVSIDWGVGGHVDEGFELVDLGERNSIDPAPADSRQEPISLFDPNIKQQEASELGPIEVKLTPPPAIQQSPRASNLYLPMYPNFRCNIYAIIRQGDNAAAFPSRVKIKGDIQGKPVSLEVPVVPVEAHAGQKHLIHKLAAKALIQDFEGRPTTPTTKAEIARLALRYSLASSVTSFVAIEEGKKDVIPFDEKEPKSDLEKEEEYDEGEDSKVMSRLCLEEESEDEESEDEDLGFGIFDDPPTPSIELFDSLSIAAHGGPVASNLLPASPPVAACGSVPAPETPTKRVESTIAPRTIGAIARLQNFDGAFYNDSKTVATLLQGKGLPPVPALLDKLELSSEDKGTVWVTAIALAILEKHFSTPDERTAWSLLASKAQELLSDLLEDAGVEGTNKEDLLEQLTTSAMAIL